MTPLISIVIPLYNKRNFILGTIDSVLEQNYGDFEIVVVDDGSTDDSFNVVNNVKDERIKLYKKDNGGPSSARNYGVQKARGKWVLFLDADDILEEGALRIISNDINKHRFADVFTYNLYVNNAGNRYLYRHSHKRGYIFFPFLAWYLEEIYPGPGRTVFKREVLQNETFREDIRRWEDGECIFRIMRRYRIYANTFPLFTYIQDNNEASKPRDNTNEDFICQMDPKGKSFFEQMAMFKLYQEACLLYPEQIESIYGDFFRKKRYTITAKLLFRYQAIKRKLTKTLSFFSKTQQ